MHWLPILVILLYIVIVWFPNMLKKDKSLARYPDRGVQVQIETVHPIPVLRTKP